MAIYQETPEGLIPLKTDTTQTEVVQQIEQTLRDSGATVSPCVKDILKTPAKEIK